MKSKLNLILIACIALLTVRCKDDKLTAPKVPVSDCLLTEEEFNDGSSLINLKYEYNAQQEPSNISVFFSAYLETNVFDVSSTQVKMRFTDATGEPAWTTFNYFGDEIFTGKPTHVDLSVTRKGVTQVAYRTYTFFYDYKGRLAKVSDHTEAFKNDVEYDLTISYNDDDNVIALEYEVTTGPRYSLRTTVGTYDDKPTPYANVKGHRFLMSRYQIWNPNNVGDLITALSKNNPLSYTPSDGIPRTNVFAYNENGFPTSRTTTFNVAGQNYSLNDTFTYACK